MGVVVGLLLGVLPGAVGVAHAATGPVTVSLAFDDEFANQYSIGYQAALQPHATHATFYVNSGIVGGTGKLTWAQLQTMGADGNEIGGKTVDGTNLTTVDSSTATAEVCNDRQALIAHGFTDPISFAYPFSARNAAVKSIVAGCGYGSGRTSGSLSPAGPRYSGPNPPDDYYDIRAWAPNSQITLAQLQTLVTGAFNNPAQGGWAPIVIQRVCDQTLDPNGYAACKAGGWIELSDLNAFLDWVKNAGQGNSAPAGTTIATVGQVLAASDATPPVTTASCNGAACTSDTYQGGTATVTMAATDAGSGTASTHYTTDGSDPTLSSPAYTGPITVNVGSTTVMFRSWDNAGNVEATKSQAITVAPAPDTTPPTTSITCDGNPCTGDTYSGGVTVELSATDNPGGMGVDKTYYTLDGSDPTHSSPVYTAPFMLAGNTTVKFFSTDLAGNAETPQTQQLSMTPFPVTVSLTFDDQYEDAWLYARPLLLSHNMNATFYVITDDTNNGFSCCMSWDQLRTLQAEGNDIGGHGVLHLNLTDPSTTLAQKQADVCGSRTDLINNGITNPTSFAYPFGAFDSTAESIVQSCGYLDSRAAGGISPTVTSPGPPWKETIPPADPLAIKAIDVDGTADKSLADLESFVTAAAIHGGGWLPLVFHQVCHEGAADFADCMNQIPVRDTVLGSFMDWLQNAGQQGGAPGGTTVKTVSDVIKGLDTTPPTTTIQCGGSACASSTYFAPVSVSLSATDNAGGTGVDKTYYTTDGSDPTTTSPVYTGPFSISTTTTVKFFSTDVAGNAEGVQSQLIQASVDTTAPTTTVSCNSTTCSAGWYQTTPVTVALSATDDTGGSGVDKTYYTTDGTPPTTGSPVYTGPFNVSATTTVRFFSTDLAGNAETPQSQSIQVDATAPTTSITCNATTCSSGWYRTTPVTVRLAATDNNGGSGVDKTYFTTNGSTPTTGSPLYTGPFNVSATTTVRFFSTDKAGNAEAPQSQLIQVDKAAPTTSITCNGANCSNGWYQAPVTVRLPATDNNGGSGVDKTYYTTDGTTPTTGSPVYTGPFNVSATTTVRFFSTDVAGNAESPKSRLIHVDPAGPAVSITQPADNSSFVRGTRVTFSANASDGSGVSASGVANVAFYVDGVRISTDSSSPYSTSWNTTGWALGLHTLTAIATDRAGNTTTSSAITVRLI